MECGLSLNNDLTQLKKKQQINDLNILKHARSHFLSTAKIKPTQRSEL